MSDACTCRINRRGRDGLPVSVDRDHDCPRHGVSCLVPIGEQFEVSMRSFLKALEQREAALPPFEIHVTGNRDADGAYLVEVRRAPTAKR